MVSRRELRSDILWSTVAIGIVAGGFAGFRVMGALRTPLAAAPIERVVPLVESAPLRRHERAIPVRGEGFVEPERQVSVAAETAGRVVELHPQLFAHGRVRAGEVLVRLDDRSARAALARADADIAATRARIALNDTQLERARTLRRRGVVSQEELDQRLAREAELAGALASLESARRGVEIALENAVVRAPFDGAVRGRTVELGSVVAPGQPLAELFSIDALEVSVPLTERAAALVPGLFERVPGAGANGVAATVVTTFAGHERARPARVVRVASGLDAGTRLLDVTVALEPEPGYGSGPESRAEPRSGADVPPAGRPPALVGGYAHVTIDGATLADVYAVPSSALRPGQVVWLVADGVFAVRPATLVHVDGATSYVRVADLPPGAELVTGVVDTPIDGMRVQVAGASGGSDESRPDEGRPGEDRPGEDRPDEDRADGGRPEAARPDADAVAAEATLGAATRDD